MSDSLVVADASQVTCAKVIVRMYGILWNIMEYYGILWNIMECIGIVSCFLVLSSSVFYSGVV